MGRMEVRLTKHLESLESVHARNEIAFGEVERLNISGNIANDDFTLSRSISNRRYLTQ